MKTDTLIDEREEVDLLEGYEGKWKNLHFSTCGKSGLSGTTYSSEKDAFDRLVFNLNDTLRFGYYALSFTTINGLLFNYKGEVRGGELQYSHTFQVPHKGE